MRIIVLMRLSATLGISQFTAESISMGGCVNPNKFGQFLPGNWKLIASAADMRPQDRRFPSFFRWHVHQALIPIIEPVPAERGRTHCRTSEFKAAGK
jgi:hypothetical protein